MDTRTNDQEINAAIEKLAFKHQLAVEHLTEGQLADAVRQSILSGDFQRHISTDNHQSVTYTPFRKLKDAERERDEAREELEIARLQRDEAVVDYQRVFKERETARGEADRYFKERNKAQEEAELLRATLVACESKITDGGYAESDSGQVVYEKANKTLEFVK